MNMQVINSKAPGGFRPLTAEEIMAVSGGGDLVIDEEGSVIVVTGPKTSGITDTSFIPSNIFGGGYDLGGLTFGGLTFGDGDSGGGSVEDYCSALGHINDRDNQVDFQAQQIANAIRAMGDWNAREYGAVIYEVDGVIKFGQITRGETVAEAQDRRGPGSQPETRISIPSDLGNGRILAVVHSHPDVGYNDAGDIMNRYPSNNVGSTGDYQTFNALVGSDSRFSNSAEFAQYILGPDGVLREFNASEGVVTAENDQDPNSRSQLNADRQTQCE